MIGKHSTRDTRALTKLIYDRKKDRRYRKDITRDTRALTQSVFSLFNL